MPELINALRAQHTAIRASLEQCRQKQGNALAAELQGLKPTVQAHLRDKDALFAAISEACGRTQDHASLAIARIFENNIKVIAAGITGFFDQLDALTRNLQGLEQRTKTVAEVLRNLIETEERALLPLFAKLHPQK